MAFLESLSRFNETLQNDPQFQRAVMQNQGFDPRTIAQSIAPLEARQAGMQKQQVIADVLSQIGDRELTESDVMQLFAIDPEMAEFIVETKKRQAPSSAIGKIQADIDAGLLDAETGAAALRKATTIAPVYDPVTQRLIYAGGRDGGGYSPPQATPAQLPRMSEADFYGAESSEMAPISVPDMPETLDDSASLVEKALSQIPPDLATQNPALYQTTAATLLKDIPEQKQKMIGKQKFESAINQLQDILTIGAQKGFLTSESKPLTENILNRAFSTESGKQLSDFIGNDRATFTQTADSVRSSIMSTMMQAYGLGATQMNTLREMEMVMKQVVNGSVTKEAGNKLIGLLREREGFAPRYDRSTLEAEAKRRGLIK